MIRPAGSGSGVVGSARERAVQSQGQASIELVAGLPALLLIGLLLFQLGATGYTYTLVDAAAEAGALALAAGRSPRQAVHAALPGWARSRVAVVAGGSRVEVTARPPSPLGFLADRLEIRSVASVAGSGP